MDEERGGRRGNEGNDPFDGLRLDEDFVRRATLEEASAYTRQHLPRVRDEHGRLQKERVAQLRRYKRGLWRARLARMLKGGLGLALVAALLGRVDLPRPRARRRASVGPPRRQDLDGLEQRGAASARRRAAPSSRGAG